MKNFIKYLVVIYSINSSILFADESTIDAKQAAEAAAQNNDFRYMSAPTCFDGLPGYQGKGKSGPPKPWPPKQVGKNCEELIGKDLYQEMQKLNEYARIYNIRMMKLRTKAGYEN